MSEPVTSTYVYSGKVKPETVDAAKKAYETYKSDRASMIERVRDAEVFYRGYYSGTAAHYKRHMHTETPFIFSCIENAAAVAAESYPVPNILEREPAGTAAAEALSKILPVQFEMSKFSAVWKKNTMNKLKYGTAIYGIFYNSQTEELDIRGIDITDIYVDMHLENIQDSRFLFIAAVIENDALKKQYPEFAELFCDDSEVEGLTGSYKQEGKTQVLDCYYHNEDGKLHLMKLCKDTIIQATEDMDGYENGLYDHGMYPVVFDVLYAEKDCPFGFGMIDIGKSVQIEIDKLDRAITYNIMVSSKPRYLAKRNGGINADEFADLENAIVYYEGDGESIKAIEGQQIAQQFIDHREKKIDELKETLANRDFQQGQTSGGVTAASAIQTLRETGEKRSRKMTDDSYDAYKEIVYMSIELIRQFYDDTRTYRIEDETGGRTFMDFSNELMLAADADADGGYRPVQFDIEVIPQQENPYTREMNNNTILTLWSSGFFLPQNFDVATIALQLMNFDGSGKLISKLSELSQKQQQQMPQQQMPQQPSGQGDGLVPVDISGGKADMKSPQQKINPGSFNELVPIPITGGAI